MTATTPARDTNAHVQVIALLVDKNDPAAHIDGIHAAALASVTAYAEGRPTGSTQEDSWTRWLSGPFTKSVRRADAKTLDKLTREFLPGAAAIGKARALAFKPMPYSELPKALSKLQVSGTELPDVASAAKGALPDRYPIIEINEDLGMSTGKAAAQAAHALMAWYLTLTDDAAREWIDAGMPSAVDLVPQGLFNEIAEGINPRLVITDNGLTEVEPGTRTALVVA